MRDPSTTRVFSRSVSQAALLRASAMLFILSAKLPMAPLQPISGRCSSETSGAVEGEWNAGTISITYWSTRQSMMPGQCEVSKSPPDHGHILYRQWTDTKQQLVLHAGPRHLPSHLRGYHYTCVCQGQYYQLNATTHLCNSNLTALLVLECP